jgi:hypothetical protein
MERLGAAESRGSAHQSCTRINSAVLSRRQAGDVLVMTRLDRLEGSTRDLLAAEAHSAPAAGGGRAFKPGEAVMEIARCSARTGQPSIRLIEWDSPNNRWKRCSGDHRLRQEWVRCVELD